MAIWSRGRVYLAPAPYRKMRLNTLRRRTQGCYKYKETSWLNNRWIHFLNNDSIGLFPAGPHVTGSLRATAIVNIESNLTRTRLLPRRLSLMMKIARKGRREGAPFPWSLAVHHQSLVFCECVFNCYHNFFYGTNHSCKTDTRLYTERNTSE